MSLQPYDYVLLLLLALAVYFDLAQKKIPNFLTLPVIVGGLLSYTITGYLSGFLISFYGFSLGIGIFLIPFALGGMGGGDVKLMGAIGALKGAEFIFYTALCTAVLGGVIALLYLLASGKLTRMLRKLINIIAAAFFQALALRFRNPLFEHMAGRCRWQSEPYDMGKPLTIPYGVAIVLGTLAVMSGFVNYIQ